MKNLELKTVHHKDTSEYGFREAENIHQTNDSIYFIKNKILHEFNFANNTLNEVVPSEYHNILTIKLMTIERKICMVDTKQLHIIDVDSESLPKTIDIPILNEDETIVSASWSPSEEILVLITSIEKIVAYSIDYDRGDLFEMGRSSLNALVPDTVYVGWGSKDTQFKGSAGGRRAKKADENQQCCETVNCGETKPVITWRGNGEMFAVNYLNGTKRDFLVFDSSSLEPKFRCDKEWTQDGGVMMELLAWRPLGNMVAAIGRASKNGCNENRVVVFEKNGQKRFEFSTEIADLIVSLKWSQCARALALQTEHSLSLFTTSNYQWYCKQKLQFSPENRLINYEFLDSNEFEINLRVITELGCTLYTFEHTKINRALTHCAVINGRKIQITDFSKQILPPPMCEREIHAENQINFVCFSPDGAEFLTVDSENNIQTNPGGFAFNLNQLENLNPSKIPLNFFNFSLNPGTNLLEFSCLQQNGDLQCYILNLENKTIEENHHEITEPNFVLDINGVLQLSGDVISEHVTSFLTVDSKYLLYTNKSTNEICCGMRTSNLNRHQLAFKVKVTYKRQIERGATIVCAVPNTSLVVLQMPRGNLECVSIRSIAIDHLDTTLLRYSKWRQAIQYVRTEKLNVNLLFYLDFERFVRNLGNFIDAADECGEFDAILGQIEDATTVATSNAYQNTIETKHTSQNVIAAIIDYSNEHPKRIQRHLCALTIMTLHHRDLHEAMQFFSCNYTDFGAVQTLDDVIAALRAHNQSPEEIYKEALLTYDLQLAGGVAQRCQIDPRVCEPELARFAAIKDEATQRMAINVHAKRMRVALRYALHSTLPDEEIVEFVRSHKLAGDAYAFSEHTSKCRQEVALLFAVELQMRECYREAGCVLLSVGSAEKAFEVFVKGLEWRDALHLLDKNEIQLKRPVIERLATSLKARGRGLESAEIHQIWLNDSLGAIDHLVDAGEFGRALNTARANKHTDVVEGKIVPALKERADYYQDHLAESLEQFKKHKNRLLKLRREKLEKKSLEKNFNHDGTGNIGDCDLYSDAGSVLTSLASISNRSSRSNLSTVSARNRRKEERKKQDLREGAIYEDIALIRALHLQITEIYKFAPDVQNICLWLVQENVWSVMKVKRALFDAYASIEKEICDAVPQIWPTHIQNGVSHVDDVPEHAVDLENNQHLDPEFRIPPQIQNNSKWGKHLFPEIS